MHMSEKFEAFWQLICREDNIRLLDEVRSQVDCLVVVLLNNVLDFLEFPIC